ncbi:HEPN domain-containing protein [Anatilimnocola sp. NA78]|uniref:HEPN domain-containing protein n=1 Tax=Anatilimnocola sp. NA78 TaxID=3415683 RepID=UPI003CE5AD09
MKADEFLAVAKNLQMGTREAEWRSAVSRAYYAAFHSALTMITSCGVRFGKSSAAHDKLAMCLQNSGNHEVATAGAKLSSLRAKRNNADYDLQSLAFGSSRVAETQIAIAEEIIAAVHGRQADQPLVAAIRSYAKDLLGLTVTENR